MIGLPLIAMLASSPGMSNVSLEAADLLTLAETEYRQGLEARADASQARPHFRDAAAAFERLWILGYRTPALARNTAQAHLLAGDLARAIRAYHRGLRIAAHDPDLRAGIAFVRESVRFPMTGNLATEARAYHRRTFLSFGPAWRFGALAAAVYVLAALCAARGWMSRRPVWFVLSGGLMFVAILMAGAVLWEDKHLTDHKALPIAIVTGDGAALHRGNGSEFPLRLAERLPPGVELIVMAERGGWLQVHLGGGAIGWVDAKQVLRVDSVD